MAGELKHFVLQDITLPMRVPAIETGKLLEKKATDQIKDFFKAKNSCLLTPYCSKLIGTFGEENAFRPCDE